MKLFFPTVNHSLTYNPSIDGLPLRTHLKSNEHFEEQFIRTESQNKLGISLVTKVLGYKPTNDYIKATSDNIDNKFVLIIGDSHAHTSFPGLSIELKNRNINSILLSNSSCPPYFNGATGRNKNEINNCKEKISSIYSFINKFKNIIKVILITRGPAMMNDIGYGAVDGGNKPYGFKFQNANQNGLSHKDNFKLAFKNTFAFFDTKNIEFYYILENPELGFHPKDCVERPFDLFDVSCKIEYTDYIKRAGEYRSFINELAKEYNKNTYILDSKELYCDDKFCYAVRFSKMLYADDDHQSVDGSILQARFLINNSLGNSND